MNRLTIVLLLSCLWPCAGASERRPRALDNDVPTLDQLGVPLRLTEPAADKIPLQKPLPPKAADKPVAKTSLYEDLDGLPQGTGSNGDKKEEPFIVIEEQLGAFPIRHLRPEPPPLPAPALLDVPVFDIWWISTYAEFASRFSGRSSPATKPVDEETPIVKALAGSQPRKIQAKDEPRPAQISLSWKDAFLQNDLSAHKRSMSRDYFQRDLPLDFYKTYQEQEGSDPAPAETAAPMLDEKLLSKPATPPKIREPEFLPTVIMLKDGKEEQDKLVERMKELNKQREKERELLEAIEKALQDISEGGGKGN